MQAYLIRRMLLIIPTIFMVTLVVFFSVRFIPGDVVEQLVQDHVFASTMDKDKTVEAIRAKLGLDVPIHVQYGRWVGNIILHGDFGDSLWKGTPVLQEVLNRLPISIELTIIALLIGLVIALPIGIYSAIRQDTWGDYLGRCVAITFIALPSFWLGVMVVVFPSVWWGWAPATKYVPFFENPGENLKMFLIPAILVGLLLSGTTMRMTRTMMLETLRQDYIRTAWAKGLKERVVIIRHALKNALMPVVTIVGIQVPTVLVGGVIMEQIFNLPGIGRLLLVSISSRDYTLISGINLFIAFFVLILNLGVDLTYSYLDPRIRYR